MQDYFRNLTTSFSSVAKTIQERCVQGRQYRFGSLVVEELGQIAEGGFGFIFLCRDFQSEKQYVVKKLICQDKERLALAEKEVEIYGRIGNHSNIVQYFGHCIEQIDFRSKEVNILFEYLPNGHLLDLLNTHSGMLTEKLIVAVLLDVAKALTHLHEMNIQNRDVKIENVLQASDGRWVLVDLGSWSDKTVDPKALSKLELATVQEEIERFTTMMYRSPEMVDMYKGFHISTKTDIWMLGCVLFTLMHNKHPFQEESQLAITNARFHLDPSIFSRFSHPLVDLLFLLLAESPHHRPSASQIVDILTRWSANSVVDLPDAVKDRVEKVFRIHGVKRTHVTAPSTGSQAPVLANSPDDNWANFDDHSPKVVYTADWTADFGQMPSRGEAIGTQDALFDFDFDSAPVSQGAVETSQSAAQQKDVLDWLS